MPIPYLSQERYGEVVETVAEIIEAEVERQLSRQLWISNQELKAANESLQKFTSIVAHDLRGPLRRIEAFVDVLQSDFRSALDAEGADILDRISVGAGRMRLMLDSLLQYTRYSSAAIVGKTANMEDVIDDALSAFDWQALGATKHLEMNGVSLVKGDPVLLSHVFQNLLCNAVKFRGEARLRVDIHVIQNNEEIRISVSDNGIGIDSTYAEKIFDMFYRLHAEDEYEGTGIGLTICRKIVNDHGGKIWLDSGYSGGTKIVFTLPLATSADQQSEPPPRRVKFMVASPTMDSSDAPRQDRTG
jgi:signal transduction histidine kinase